MLHNGHIRSPGVCGREGEREAEKQRELAFNTQSVTLITPGKKERERERKTESLKQCDSDHNNNRLHIQPFRKREVKLDDFNT